MMKYVYVSAITGGMLLGCASWAQESSPLETIYACSSIESDAERLACYDDAVGRTQTAQEAGEFTTVTRQEAEDVQRDTFGFSLPSLPRFNLPTFGGGSNRDDGVQTNEEGEITEVTLQIERIYADAYDKVVIEFENGQRWRQSDSDRIRISRLRPPTEATIKRASLGSFLIRLNTGERFKATREQ